VLAAAWTELANIPLVVAGEGPMAGTVEGMAGRAASEGGCSQDWPPYKISFIGRQPPEKVLKLMRDARVLVFPSQCYENAPMTILEAFASGLPVIASNLGSMAEMVAHEKTGLLFEAGDAADLARKVRWAFEHPEAMEGMRAAARREFEEKYSADRNYEMLMAIYETAIENSKRERRAAS
jgi:glycosyltransferase involved in cell wall biosynthesis